MEHLRKVYQESPDEWLNIHPVKEGLMIIQAVLHQPTLLLPDNSGSEAHRPFSNHAHFRAGQDRSGVLARPDPHLAQHRLLLRQLHLHHLHVQSRAQSVGDVRAGHLHRREPEPDHHGGHQHHF